MTTADFASTQPDNSDLYTDVLGLLRNRNMAVAEAFVSAPTNPAVSMVRYVRATSQWEEYDGAAWQRAPMVLSVAGGGTGAITAAAARTALGLGTIATQAASAVAISGGTISGISTFTISGTATAALFSGSGASLTNLVATNLATGNVPIARMPTGGTWTLSSALVVAARYAKLNGFGTGLSTKTSGPYSSLIDDTTLLVNTDSGAITINLIAASSNSGKMMLIRNIGTSGNNVTLDGNSSETIDGSATHTLSDGGSILIQCDGSNWFSIGGSMVKKVTAISIAISGGSGAQSGTQTISPAMTSTTKAWISAPGYLSGDDSARNFDLKVTNTTTVTGTRQSVSSLAAGTITGFLIEAY